MRKFLFFFLAIITALPLFAGANGDLRKGNAAYDSGKYGEAFEFYNKAAEEGAPDKGFYNSGAALYRLKDYSAAAKAYENVDAESEFKQDALYNAANAYYNKNNPEKAKTMLRRALLMKRDDKAALHNLQFILQEQQNNQNKQDRNNNQGENKNDSDNQKDSDDKSQNGNSEPEQNKQNEQNNSDNQNSPEQQEEQPSGLSSNEADNILQMSKEFSPDNQKNMGGFGANTVDKDW